MCYMVSFSQAVSVMLSAYTLVVISMDRYVAIIYPLKPRLTHYQAKVSSVENKKEHPVSYKVGAK